MKYLCIGNISYDVTMPISNYPLENTKTRSEDKIECGGGPASTAAYLLGKWNTNCYFSGVIGDDIYGKKLKEEFNKVNVNVNYLQINNLPTTFSFIIANKENGSRTIFTHRNNDTKLKEYELNFQPDVILMDGQEYEMSIKLLDEYPNSISIIDAGRCTENVINLAKKVKYLVTSKSFAEEITNMKVDITDHQTLKEMFLKVEEIFNNIVIITLEENGSMYRDNNTIKIVHSIKVKAVDSTGAGDIFHGAFTYFISKGLPMKEVLFKSNIAGAISVTRLGGRNSVPSLEEINNVYEKLI